MAKVCTYCGTYVGDCDASKRKINKIPALCTGDANPHFEELTEDSKDATVPSYRDKGKNL
jgi:hypothetical protein